MSTHAITEPPPKGTMVYVVLTEPKFMTEKYFAPLFNLQRPVQAAIGEPDASSILVRRVPVADRIPVIPATCSLLRSVRSEISTFDTHLEAIKQNCQMNKLIFIQRNIPLAILTLFSPAVASLSGPTEDTIHCQMVDSQSQSYLFLG